MMVDKAADEGSSGRMDDFFNAEEGCDDVYLDLDSFWRAMGEPPEGSEPKQGSLDDSPFLNSLEGMDNSARTEVPESCLPSPLSEASDCRTVCSEGFSEFAGKSTVPESERLESSSPQTFAETSFSQTVTDFMPLQASGVTYTHAGGEFQTPSSEYQNDTNKAPLETFSQSETFSNYAANHTLHNLESSEFCHPNHEIDLFGCSRTYAFSENLYHQNLMEDRDLGASVVRMEDSFIMDSDLTSQDASHTESSSYEAIEADMADILSENGGRYVMNSEDQPCFPYSSGPKSLASHGGRTVDFVVEGKNRTEDSFSHGGMSSYEYVGGNEVGLGNTNCLNGGTVSLNSRVGATDMHPLRNQLNKPSHKTFSNGFGKIRNHIKVEKNYESITSNEIVSRASEVIDDVISRNQNRGMVEPPATEGMPWSLSHSSSLISHKNYVPRVMNEKELLFDSHGTFFSHGVVDKSREKSSVIVADSRRHVLRLSSRPDQLASSSIKAELNCLKMDNAVPKFNGYLFSDVACQGVQNNRTEQINDDDDPDVCILEDMSAPARPSLTEMRAKLVAASHFSSLRDSAGHIVSGHPRPKQNDERVIFRVALQDLSLPKSEATPPDGALAVSLLKHQRVALSWMVNKETKNACCSGGILADDQGLGKTVSTIALILKERSPSSKAPKTIEEQFKTETLNLDEDEDDDGASEASLSMAGAESFQTNDCSSYIKTSQEAKGRPAAGTLIVCPTSVLRQWSEELHTKVTREADLSVLVYHGSNRTKDPIELAKYDVVVTTYAIVSMEVPKQPVVDENADSIGTPYEGFSSDKKRKPLETMGNKKSSRSKKSKKGIENELLETLSGPLAKVGWFRVVLDEAQSIKNHRTQVARACWGLRAKRRWCLSGTPIQNSIDDLYSYFRFLRHEPYAVFATFCEQLKAPIQRSPKNGYKKLQAVLKTIMLRRTKGTVINGEPIINLPPKTIKLQQVDFSMEERDFYRTLEADSQAQFAEYAAKGTVKQNYINILLMLLRLRQACDHPLLVKDCNSNSKMTSSIQTAKKLPREKQFYLLNCLEASLAICGICNDPPEDAVVTVCGHVFCNQCICEHMIGGESLCPTKNCRTHLTAAHIFSITSLRIALSDQPSMENIPNSSGSDLAQVSEPRALSSPEDSSKIKAALEILLSISKPQDCASRTSSSEFIKGSPGSEKVDVCDLGGQNGISDMKRDPNDAVKVVGEKAIVFSQWTRMLDLLETCLKNSSIQYRRLDGTMPVTARDRAVKDFNSLPEVSVMIMSLKAASLGLNMVAACNVLLLDLWWNPTTEDQAIDRAHRIGQTRPVSVFRLTVRDTVEDRILALQQRKREMVASAFGEDETGSRQTRLTVDDLKYLFRVD